MDDRGQISTELIIIIAAILAVALWFVKSFATSSEKAVGKMRKGYDQILDRLDKMLEKTPKE